MKEPRKQASKRGRSRKSGGRGGGRGGGGRSFGGGGGGRSFGGGGGGGGGARQMYPAKCAECGNDCEVPFEPKEDRPVFCRSCFQSRRPPSRF